MSATATTTYSIRPAEANEGDRILPCYDWLFAPPGGVPPAWDAAEALDRLRNTLGTEGAALFVAENETGDIIGICSVYIDIESVRYGLRGWVEDLAIAPESRSGGVGAALLRAAREWAKEHGATHLELDSGARRSDAHRFYERLRPSWTGVQYAWQL